MTLQEVQALTDDEIRVRIAELRGRVRRPDGNWFPLGSTVGSQGIPNYPSDLNACHEVERTLTIDQASEYREDLIYVIANAHWQTHGPAGDYDYHATARQRCEALILTLTQP